MEGTGRPRQVSFGGDTSRPNASGELWEAAFDAFLGQQPASPESGGSSASKPLDILTRATQAEARAEKAEAEILRVQKALGEAQQRQKDTNQLLKRLGDANVSLRAELERVRAGGTGVENEGGGRDNVEDLQERLRIETLEAARWQDQFHEAEGALAGDERTRRVLRLSENLESRLSQETAEATRWRARFDELQEASAARQPAPTASVGAAASTQGADAHLARAEVEALRHRVWTNEREVQEKKRLLAVSQADASRWQDRCFRAEARLKQDSSIAEVGSPMHSPMQSATTTPRQTPREAATPRYEDQPREDPLVLQELSNLRSEATRNELALEAATRSQQGWEANTANAMAAAGNMERQEAALAVQLSMTQQSLESVEERLAAAPTEAKLATSHEELRVARLDADGNRSKLSEMLRELQSCEKALRGAEFELELERRTVPVASLKAQNDADAAEKNLRALRQTMQAEESLRLEVSKALTDTQREARGLQVSLHNEECALTRCSGDLVKEVAAASTMSAELQQAREESAQFRADASADGIAMRNALKEEATKFHGELLRLESNTYLQTQHWKARYQVQEDQLETINAELTAAQSETEWTRAEMAASALALPAHGTSVHDGQIENTSTFQSFSIDCSLSPAFLQEHASLEGRAAELANTVELANATCLELEARLQEECTQKAAAIAHAAHLTAQVVTLGASHDGSILEAALARESVAEAQATELMAKVHALQAVERSLRESESMASAQICQLRLEVSSLQADEMSPGEPERAFTAEIASLRRTESRLHAAEAHASVQVAELTVEVASLQAAEEPSRKAASGFLKQIADLTSEVTALREAESKAAAEIGLLMTEVASLQAGEGPLSDISISEQQASAQNAELMLEIESLRSLHEHAIQHGKDAALALRNLENESVQELKTSAENAQLSGELNHYRDACVKLEHAENQLARRLSTCENSMYLEASFASDSQVSQRCEALEKEEQRLVTHLHECERLWAFELAAGNAAADAWRERCEKQEAIFVERDALLGSSARNAVEEAEKASGCLRDAREDAGRWRGRVQELHEERQHMESALEALARARNSWRAKAEATERQLQSALVATSNKAECLLQEKDQQSQAEMAGVRSQLGELQARAQSDIQRAQEKLLLVEREAQDRIRAESMELGALSTSLSEARTRSDMLEQQKDDLKREQALLQAKLAEQIEDASTTRSKLQVKIDGQSENASDTQSKLREKLAEQNQEVTDMQIQIKQAERRYNATESGLEFLHTELARTRRDSEHVWKALAVEQKEASVLRCRIKELEVQLQENGVPCSAPDRDHDTISTTSNLKPALQKKLEEDDGVSLGALRQELRDTKGRAPLSDMTGAWQRVQALEPCPTRDPPRRDGQGAIHDMDLSAVSPDDRYKSKLSLDSRQPGASPDAARQKSRLGATSPDKSKLSLDSRQPGASPDARQKSRLGATSPDDRQQSRIGGVSPDERNKRTSRTSGARSNTARSNTTPRMLNLPPSHSPNASPPAPSCRSLRMGMPTPTSGLRRLDADPSELLAESFSSSVATRLSGCLSPVDWLVGKGEALGSPETCEMGLQRLGGLSLECSPASQPRSQQLALPASPLPSGSTPVPERRGGGSFSPLPGGSPLLEASPLGGSSPQARGLRC